MTNHPAEWAREKAKELLKDIDRRDNLPPPMNYMTTHRKDFVEFVAQALIKQRDETLEEAAKVCETHGDSMLSVIKESSKKSAPYHTRSQGTAKGYAIGASRMADALRQLKSK